MDSENSSSHSISSPQMFQNTHNNSAMEDNLLSRPMNNESLQMIIGYLRRNGLTETEELLTREAGPVLRVEGSNGLPPEEAISVEFDTFVQHANDCTDVVQAEFSQLLFPIFAHSYIALIEKHAATARIFFNRFKIFIPECFSEFVYQLSLIEDAMTLRANEHVHILRENKFLVRLSRPTLKHLESIQTRVIGVKNIIAKHICIENADEVSTNRTTIETQMGGILGVTSKSDKRHKMMFSVLKDELMQNIEKRKTKGKDWKDMGKKMQTHCPQADRIPLPPISEHLREERRNWLRDVGKMAIISAESPVSICMYTTVNAPIGVASCDFTDDSSLIAMGLSDSSIVMNAMDPMNKMKKLRDMEFLDKIDIETADNVQSQMFDLQGSTTSVRYTGHGGPVFSVNFSPDRRLLISSAGDRTVRLWSMETQRNAVIYRTPAVVWQAQFCSRGYYFATASADKTAAMWSTDRMHPLRIFADPYGDVGCIDYHPNCNYIAGGSDDRYVRVWDVCSGTRVRIFSGHKASIIAVKFSPCGRYIVSLDAIGNLMIWDLAYQRLVAAEITEQAGTKGSITFSRDGGVFAVSHGNSSIQLYSLDTLIGTVLAAGQNDSYIEPKVNLDGFNIGSYATKETAVIGLHFTRRNLLLGFGCFGQ
ncbi:Transcription initiation factor TFIID subunit 5 [Caenorhabditis elegans]|uniref:Transcription initiation factor TFIID subunit 5 n=1 Tax=Caenorhabditis elegans TaxID=6239 RepID=TAF5_CAEEL|nr:Transcription initiation factor TFIID subunit 5 [Caenorhabditis elegans]G5EF68.1 RecName: Full=Transcription initiation factor TFIID subunit 5; AltName: Full=TBP-associated transcription factor family member taf-5 [Caenorhabditis elegans]CAB03035.2 Transcription initiation factor TFIID subunit 5 [Caenorhabditis elegans]|eukprot:NP_492169.2 TAF (TBP-associated transcription factor) family [Caenorhabditis elegans]